MKNLLPVLFLLFGCNICLAQYGPQGQLDLYYQRVQGFDYRSGSSSFDIEGANLNGGGFGIGYNLTDVFSIWTQTSFYTGAKQGDLDLKFINQIQGIKLTKRDLGSVNLFVKGGMGFARYVFKQEGFSGESVFFSQTFNYGGGAEIGIGEGIYFFVELSQMSMGLPNITGSPDRDKWDSNILITSGISLFF
jgi:hypothetical protein